MKKILSLIAPTLVLASQSAIASGWLTPLKGNGVVAREEISSHAAPLNFNISGPVEVHIVPGSNFKAVISADSNLMSEIKKEVNASQFTVAVPSFLRPRKKVLIEITSPRVDSVEISGAYFVTFRDIRSGERLKLALSGAGQAEARGIESKDLEVAVTGSGSLTLVGSVKELKVSSSGSTRVMAGELNASHAAIDANGNSNISLGSMRQIKGNLSGNSSLHLKTSPEVQQVSTSGQATVIYDKP